MATGKKDDATDLNLPALGEAGEACAECGAALATDQRYCLNCGVRRGGPRLDFERLLPALAANGSTAGAAGGVAPSGPAAPMMVAPARTEWSPLVAVACIAVLGGMLLLGVLIGNDKSTTTVAGTAPTATTATTAAAAPTPTTAAAPTGKPAAKTAKAGAGATAAVAGGSGNTTGIAAADTSAKTGKAAADASKNSPNVVATSGAPAAQDPNGQAGGGSGATVIK